MPDAWADLGIPDFLRISPEERKAAWKRNPPKSLRDHKGQKRPFHLPKTIEPAGLKLLKEAEREAERKKAERLEALKALPKRPSASRTKRRSLRAKAPPKRKGKQNVTRDRKRAVLPGARSRARN